MAKYIKLLSAFGLFMILSSGSGHALTTYSGTDPAGMTGNSDAAFALWQSNVVGGGTIDDLSTLSCAANSCTTVPGNKFDLIQGISLSEANFTSGVIMAENLQLVRDTGGSVPASYTWDLAGSGANAFAFFGHDNDGGVVTIQFSDGSVVTQNIFAEAGSDANMFFGVTGANSLIDLVTITTTDPPGFSYWDNFAFGATVPIPAALPLFLSALALLGIVSRRRRPAEGATA